MSFTINNNLLIIGHFSPSVGYAWDTIADYFCTLGEMFLKKGNRALVCYPKADIIPEKFKTAGVEVILFDFSKASLIDVYRLIRKYRIRTVYLTDRPVFSPQYLMCRLAGVRKIVIHDRTSGERDTPGPFKRWIKTMINHYPIMSADIAIAISEYVRQRLIRISCFPEERTVKIWNGVNIDKFSPGNDDYVYRHYAIPGGKKIVFAYSRANKYKGIQTLIEAAEILIHEKKRDDLFFLYCGDGPDIGYFRSLIAEKDLNNFFLCPGKTGGIDRILKGVSIVVVPSIWQVGFGLSVVEGMASERVVVASRVGGIVEIIRDGEDGYLFPAGDSEELSSQLSRVLDDEYLREKTGRHARSTVISSFNIEDKKKELVNLFENICFSVSSADNSEVLPGRRLKAGK